MTEIAVTAYPGTAEEAMAYLAAITMNQCPTLVRNQRFIEYSLFLRRYAEKFYRDDRGPGEGEKE